MSQIGILDFCCVIFDHTKSVVERETSRISVFLGLMLIAVRALFKD